MSEPFGNKWKKYNVWPNLLKTDGGTANNIKLNIGDGSLGTQGTQGIQGVQGPEGNPNLTLTSPDGTLWEIIIDNNGNLNTKVV